MTAASAIVAAVTLVLAAPALYAQRIELDDSLSPADLHRVDLSPLPGSLSGAMSAILSGGDAEVVLIGQVPGVDVRLNTRAYIDASARIYLTLPLLVAGLDGASGLELRWEATGPFLPGTLRPGQSALVFDGTVTDAVTRGTFDFVFVLENGLGAESFDMEPVYEIEILP